MRRTKGGKMAKTAVVTAPPSILVTLAKQFKVASADVEAAEETLKKLKNRRDAIQAKFADQMKTEGVTSMRVDGLGGFRFAVEVYPNVKDKEAFEKYVNENKKTLGFLLTKSVHGGKLKSYVKDLLENSQPLPPFVETFMKDVVKPFK